MNDPLIYYYLQQMGIQPWLIRKSTAVNLNDISILKNSVRLLIIVATQVSYGNNQDRTIGGKPLNLLNKMIQSVGIAEHEVHIMSVIETQLTHKQTLQENNGFTCPDFISKEISAVNPQMILALGRVPGLWFNNELLSLHAMRNRSNYFLGKPVSVSFDPEHLLRHPEDKKKAFADLIVAKRLINDSSNKF